MSVLDSSPVLLRNRTPNVGHWIRFKTIGSRSNRDGFGARLELKAGKLTQTLEVRANSSFESACDPRVHFGLGSATRVDSMVVRWPSGQIDQLGAQTVDHELTVGEGKGVVAH